MPCLDIPVTKSLTVSSKYINSNINNEYIYIGNNNFDKYISYLYFDISSIPLNIKNIYATLVLFKKPTLIDIDNCSCFGYSSCSNTILHSDDNNFNFGYDTFYNHLLDDTSNYCTFGYDSCDSYCTPNFNCTEKYSIYPLIEYFSKYTTFNNRPKYDSSLRKNFLTSKESICEEIDITRIVSNWISGRIQNKGLMLKGREKNTNLIEFFSGLNKHNSDIPFIRIYFKSEKFYLPLIELDCTCSLFPPVKRRST